MCALKRRRVHSVPGQTDATKHCHVENQCSALLWWLWRTRWLTGKKPKQSYQQKNKNNTLTKQKKTVHEEWQIVFLVQFVAGTIACMSECWVYVWIFLCLLLTHRRVTLLLTVKVWGGRKKSHWDKHWNTQRMDSMEAKMRRFHKSTNAWTFKTTFVLLFFLKTPLGCD